MYDGACWSRRSANDTAAHSLQLAQTDFAEGRLATAEEHAIEALRRKQKSGETDEQLAVIWTTLGAIRLERGATGNARKDALQAIDVLGEFEPPGECRSVDRGRVRALCLLSRCDIALGNYEEALQMLARARSMAEDCLEPACDELCEVLVTSAELCRESGYAFEAEEYYRAALEVAEEINGAFAGEVAAICQRLALLADAVDDPDSLLPFARRAYAIRCSLFGSTHPYTAAAQSALAGVLDAMGEERDAREKYLHAVAVFDRHFAVPQGGDCPRPPDLMRAYDHCRRGAARHLIASGRLDDAREFSARAQLAIEQVFGRSHPFTDGCRNFHSALQRTKGGRRSGSSSWNWWRSLSFGR